MSDWLLVGFGVLLTLGTAIFVAAEFALVTLDPGLVDQRVAAQPDRRSRQVRKAVTHLSTELSGAQVGITITTILLGYTGQPAIASLLAGAMSDGPLTQGVAAVIATVGSLLIVNGFSMIVGELIPKNLALSAPWPTARMVAPLQRGFTAALRPVILGLNGSANSLLRRFGVEPKEELSGGRSAQELTALVRRSAQAGTLAVGVARRITNSIELDTLTALDVMTDRTRIEVLRREAVASDVVERALATGHSRFPVIGDSHDDVLGVVHLRRAVAVPWERREEVPVMALVEETVRVPETVTLGPLLVQLRAGAQIAVVVDEYGGTSGIVTLEDVVEELVGDVRDEHDRRRGGVRRLASGAWSVPGLLRPDELAEQTRLIVPDVGAWETLGGLVMAELGRIPEAGDEIEVAGVRIRVEAMAGRRVDRLTLATVPPPEAGA